MRSEWVVLFGMTRVAVARLESTCGLEMPSEYEFTLRFAVPASVDADSMVERLFEARCDDALIGSGEAGCIGMRFTREAESAAAAVGSAIGDVQRGVPEIGLIGTRWRTV